MTAPVFKNGEWLLPEDHDREEKQGRAGLGGSDFAGNKAKFELGGIPRGMGGDHVDAKQAANRKALLGEFMKAANIPINDPVNDEVDSINAPKIPDSGGRLEPGGWSGGRLGPGGLSGGPGAPSGASPMGFHDYPGGWRMGGTTPHHFEIGDRVYENPTPGNTIEHLPDDLRKLLLDWAHEQDKLRNDSRIPRFVSEPESSVNGAAPHDPMGNLMRLPHDTQSKLLHPKKKYFTDSNHYDTSGLGNKEYPQNVNQKLQAKNIADTLLTKQDERAHDLFKQTIHRNYDDRMENYIRNTRWKVGIDGFPEYPTPVKDYLTHRYLAIDATQPVVTNHHQHIYTKNEFEHHHHTERAPHGGVTPEQAYHLIMGLKDQKNRGAGMFEEARQRAEKHVIDESSRKPEARRPISPTLERMLNEVNEPQSMGAFQAAMESVEQDKDKKIVELQQIIRAQQEEIARLRANISSSEIPASPSGISEPKDADAAVDAARVAGPPPFTLDHEWSRKHWPFGISA